MSILSNPNFPSNLSLLHFQKLFPYSRRGARQSPQSRWRHSHLRSRLRHQVLTTDTSDAVLPPPYAILAHVPDPVLIVEAPIRNTHSMQTRRKNNIHKPLQKVTLVAITSPQSNRQLLRRL